MNKLPNAHTKFSSNAAAQRVGIWIIGSKPKVNCNPRSINREADPHPGAPDSQPIIEFSCMPEKRTMERARRDRRQGKAASTQAGEFVREEMHHIREGKHGARSTKQAIAIGLSKARRAGVNLRPPRKGRVSEKTRRSAESAYRKGQRGEKPSARRSQARLRALKHEGRSAASHSALSRQARSASRRRSPRSRSAAAHRAAQTRSQRLRRRR